MDRDKTGAREPSGTEPSAADASRALAQRLARADVVGHGTVPFRSPAEPERRGRSGVLVVGIVLAAVALLAVAAAIVATVLS